MSIEIRSCDDWVAVYRDGVKVFENHSCSLADGLRALGMPADEVDLDEKVDQDGYMLDDGSYAFPDRL